MAEKSRKKDSTSLSQFDELERFILTEPEPLEIASGYSISIKYDKDGAPQIYVKKYGEVDTRGLRREIERSYPGAAIQGLEKPKRIEMNTKRSKKPRCLTPKTKKQRDHNP
ncbi:MAG: hypothetical protein NWE78_03650 [Candidatus Bathyarchaeota archaeon]|nr:hypothetical protein [Candidatus Bathyarchaeota archaeon]